mmetsp:Transcript_58925/g.97468  ORF Transcript_58925/g.97468 Transcript_58925/m.97468 type:complete len:234 (+) Transcript_58925:152-853(+)
MVVDVNEDALRETVSMVKHNYVPDGDSKCLIEYNVVNVANADEVANSIAKCTQLFDYTNVLFNNAGIMDANDGGIDTDDATWDKTMSVNVKGVFYGCKYGIPHLLSSEQPCSVINTASFVAMRGAATPQLAYTASKGAVLSMTKELAVIYAKQGIRFNSLCPGPLRTELLMSFLDDDEKKNRRLVHIPMGRFGEATEMANAALFLASDESSYMTGQELIVDGGLCAAYVTPES